jgi:hypothetical protein
MSVPATIGVVAALAVAADLTRGAGRGGSRSISMEDLDGMISKRRGERPPGDGSIKILGYIDFFSLNDAPFVLEDRVSSSGRTYTVKVYLPEAYTDDYMFRSDETRRLIRWGVELSDGRTVSREGAFRVRFPEQWEIVKEAASRKRGEARDEYIACSIWKNMLPEEQEAMLSSVDIESYADARGLKRAKQDLLADLKQSGSLLSWVDAPWGEMLKDAYARRHLGGPVGSDEWRSATFEEFLRYKYEVAGLREPASFDPAKANLLVRPGAVVDELWRWASEYWGNEPAGRRIGDRIRVVNILRERMGPTLSKIVDEQAAKRMGLSSAVTRLDEIENTGFDSRHYWRLKLYEQIVSEMDSAWARELKAYLTRLSEVIEVFTVAFAKFRATQPGQEARP